MRGWWCRGCVQVIHEERSILHMIEAFVVVLHHIATCAFNPKAPFYVICLTNERLVVFHEVSCQDYRLRSMPLGNTIMLASHFSLDTRTL